MPVADGQSTSFQSSCYFLHNRIMAKKKKKGVKECEVKGDLQLFIKVQHHELNTVKMIINTRIRHVNLSIRTGYVQYMLAIYTLAANSIIENVNNFRVSLKTL